MFLKNRFTWFNVESFPRVHLLNTLFFELLTSEEDFEQFFLHIPAY